MDRERARQALVSGHHEEGGVLEEQADQILDLAKVYGSVHFPHLWDGPDAWGEDVKLSVSYLPEAQGYTVLFSLRKRHRGITRPQS